MTVVKSDLKAWRNVRDDALLDASARWGRPPIKVALLADYDFRDHRSTDSSFIVRFHATV